MDFLTPPPSPAEKTKVEVIQGDITDYSGVLEASRGVDVIIHTASLVDVWHKIPDSVIYSVNINGETPTGLVGGKNQGWRGNLARIREATNRRKQAAAVGEFQGLLSAGGLHITGRYCVTSKLRGQQGLILNVVQSI